jgi:hypothetical protein
MDKKRSTSIFRDLMDTAGGPSWEQWKAERTAAGFPVLNDTFVEKPKLKLEPERPKVGAAAVLP